MFDALYIGATGMRGQQMQIDAIAQNVANLNTVGYRRRTVSFAEVAASIASGANINVMSDATQTTSTADAMRVLGAGAMPTVTLSNLPGELKQTSDPLSVAIDGVGFLEVTRPDGSPAYTRAGQLRVNADGMLANADGSPLAAHIQIPSDAHDLRIDPHGVVSATVGDSADPIELGKIELAEFSNAASLKPLGDNLYAATEQSGEARVAAAGELGMGTLKQGFVENSNVQMSDELVNLMLAQRAFELNSKIIQAADQMLGIANGLYR
jgi:flagellar basal-body rod protein FlgG